MYWIESQGRIELKMRKAQAARASHPGPCDADVLALSRVPAVARQLARIEPETLRAALLEYGAWDTQELYDHAQNLQRILWLAASDIHDNN